MNPLCITKILHNLGVSSSMSCLFPTVINAVLPDLVCGYGGIAFLSIMVWRPFLASPISFPTCCIPEYSTAVKRFSSACGDTHTSTLSRTNTPSGCWQTRKQKQNPENQQPCITEAVVETVDNYIGQTWTIEPRLQFPIYSQAFTSISGARIYYLEELCD